MLAKAVIGASYGDEGKGRTVDWFAAPYGDAAIVVRSNGGAQAAHTVVRGGKRHVFHHIGSGALVGARTHLSRFMVSHPILFAEEWADLTAIGVEPKVSADPRGMVTTPWDMMVNQAIEIARDGKRHGSCGLGFGETVGRNEEAGRTLTIADLYDDGLESKLIAIRDTWLPARLEQLGLEAGEGPLEYAQSDHVLQRFLAQCAELISRVSMRDDCELGRETVLIFEAAQGLLLDQNGRDFPYVTRSNTGLANIAEIAEEAGIEGTQPVYVTRCYLTRHGRGPMEDERDVSRWFAVDDPTNKPNPWQETLRVGLLDPKALGERIRADLEHLPGAVRPSLAITCLDQAETALAWVENGAVATGSVDELESTLRWETGLPVIAQFASPENPPAVVRSALTHALAESDV